MLPAKMCSTQILAQPVEVTKIILFCITVFLDDALVEWKKKMVIFPVVALVVLVVSSARLIIEVVAWESNFHGATFDNESKTWETVGLLFSLLYFLFLRKQQHMTDFLLPRANLYSTGLIAFHIWRVTKGDSSSQSNLKVSTILPVLPQWFLSILIESAALQTFWLLFSLITSLLISDALYIAYDKFPVIIAISNTLIHARVGLGWSENSGGLQTQKTGKSPENAVWCYLDAQNYITAGSWVIICKRNSRGN
ncbi:hypothetical protein C8R45DRAFT_944872 [Mycena sanguinolenta]|nr:hypothetical protein C8R45DRAFT_944872 [Mycena sanguinolenta]